MKKLYSRPEAEVISFYTDEKITAEDISGDMGVTAFADSGWV